MKLKVWVLVFFSDEDGELSLPVISTSREKVEAALDRNFREQWEQYGPEPAGTKLPYPGIDKVQEVIPVRWEISEHDLELDLPTMMQVVLDKESRS